MELINLEKAVRLMDGDQELFGDLFTIIESSLPEKFGNVETALNTESAADLELYAHQFKGAMRNVAAEEACHLLEQLEKCGTRADFAQARKLLSEIRPSVDRLLEYYRSRDWVETFLREAARRSSAG